MSCTPRPMRQQTRSRRAGQEGTRASTIMRCTISLLVSGEAMERTAAAAAPTRDAFSVHAARGRSEARESAERAEPTAHSRADAGFGGFTRLQPLSRTVRNIWSNRPSVRPPQCGKCRATDRLLRANNRLPNIPYLDFFLDFEGRNTENP